jgi:hypothetical protein
MRRPDAFKEQRKMKIRQTIPLVSATLLLTLAFPLNARTGRDQDNVIVNFGDPVTLAGAGNQVVVPDEVSIGKGGTVTFVVYGGGHGIALYPVSKDPRATALPRSYALTIP